MPEQSPGRTDTRADDARPVDVLLVDDPETAAVSAGLLERSTGAVQVATETDPESGLDRLADEGFDCVVSGYELPGTDGVAFLEAVRERYPELPFVLFTGKGSEVLASRAIAAGVTDYVRKRRGADRHGLLARRIRSAVESHRASQGSDAERINRTIRQTTQRVMRAATRPEIERAVCETLADSEPYRFAWIGVLEDDQVVPTAWDGIERGYLDGITITTDRSPTGRGPAGRAVRTGTPQVTDDVGEDPTFEPWREAAERRGYAAAASIPLVHEDTRYGLLNVYAGRPGAFDDTELDVLAELGRTVAHAIHRVALTGRLVDQYETLFEESPVMAVTTREEDGEPVIESCNRLFVETLGYDRSEVIGRPLEGLYTASSARDLLEEGSYERALTDELASEERTLTAADGDTVETLLRAVPREDESGETVGTFALFVDISERERLKRENERLDEFASVVSHDLRNPLTVIKGHAKLASQQYDSDDIEAILEAAGRMEALVENLLEVARQGKTVEQAEPVRLAGAVRSCWRNVETAGASLRVETEAVLLADESRLRQLLENLVRNSVEHGRTAGDDGLTVTVGDLDRADGFYVADDGVGVPLDERPRIFEAGHPDSGNSTGFGLSIVAEIAEAHGWDVSLTESAEGGARFEITGVET
jgi:PAS domain S-box-containing protein